MNAILAAIAFTLAGLFSYYALRTVDKPLDYSQIASIYQSVLPMDVYYNSIVGPPFSQESTQTFMDSISKAAGSGTFNLNSQAYPEKTSD